MPPGVHVVVKPTRSYHSPRRAAQAQATRAAILDAAVDLFCTQGYAGTTMQAVAAKAGVAVESVYALASKARLLELALERTVDDGTDTALADDDTFRAAMGAADQRSQLHLFGVLAGRRARRNAQISRAYVQAAAQDESIAAAWREQERRRLQDTRLFVAALAAGGGLRPGLSVDDASRTVWTTCNWYTAWLLYEDDPDRSEASVAAWYEATLTTLLL
ncbi:TetR/AcrR family transcriptional regulator [Parafrankia sp. FMc2]|uniref:TetR/AcrR family transcriptional regulator n=1 Tax=Parafrankia sp. FMc2 TaxID=3233196 RepID=UPI0034D3AE3C